MFFWYSLAICLAAVSSAVYTDTATAYVTAYATNDVYRVDLTTGSASLMAIFPGAAVSGIVLENFSTAYVTGLNTNIVYGMNLTTGVFSQVAQFAGTGFNRIQLANSTTAYVGGYNDGSTGNIYRVNLANGIVSLVTPSPITGVPLAGLALEMTLTNPKTAYAAGTNGSVYQVDLTNGFSKIVTSIPGAQLYGLSLANNTTAYVTDVVASDIYSVDLISGSYSLVTPSPITDADLEGITLVNNTTAYAVGNLSNEVYRIDLTNGRYSQVTPSALLSDLVDISLVLQIETSGLHGNNLAFANYLNDNAPFYTLPLIALQNDIALALEIASPTRNAISTFAAQTTQLAFGQLVADHFGQKRWSKAWRHEEAAEPTLTTMSAQSPFNRNRLIAQLTDDSSMEIQDQAIPSDQIMAIEPPSARGLTYSPWLAGFGEYTREHKQRQTPAFQTGSGGFVLACDFCGVDLERVLGSGLAYAHTHVHENDGFGHANINQAAVVFYAAWAHQDYYFNTELWGSGYHTKNVREINLPGIISGSAISNTNGWQLTPHLEIGYDYKDSWLCIEPFMMVDWVANWERGFQEHKVGKLNMGQNGRFCSLLRNEWGIRFYETLSCDWGTVTFSEKGSYAYQKTFHTGTLTAFLVGSSGTFIVSTLNGAQNLGVMEFESLFTPFNKKYPYGIINYQGEFGSRYQSHQGMATIGMSF